MVSQNQYQIIRAVRDLPPRDFKVYTLNTNPFTVDLVGQTKDLGFDIEIENLSGSSIEVFLNNEDSFSLGDNKTKSISDILVQKFEITGATSGVTIICNVLALQLLQKLNEQQNTLEVR